MTLEELRAQLSAVDRELLQLVSRRQALSQAVAEVKRQAGLPTRDFKRERDVLMQARATAQASGVAPELGEAILQLLIRGSLETQERLRVQASGQGSGRSALVIGGAGKMGHWFSEFMNSQGFDVTVADKRRRSEDFHYVADWRSTSLDFDFIIVATPLNSADGILQELAQRQPRGVVFDVGSLKTPLRDGIRALQEAGCQVTSIHPMFGPDTQLLSGRHVIFIDAGCEPALQQVQGLFASTMAEQAVMSLDEHDRLIAYVLGLSHALNIAFFTALAGSGEAAPRLAQLSSTTYDAQVDVATKVASESPELYFEIQHLNDYGRESLQALRDAVERLWATVVAGDRDGFAAMMLRGREYLAGRVKQG